MEAGLQVLPNWKMTGLSRVGLRRVGLKTRLPSIFMVPRPLRQLKLATTRACYPLEGRGPYSRPGLLQSEQTMRVEQRATNSNW